MTAREGRALRWGAGIMITAIAAARLVPASVREAHAQNERARMRLAALHRTQALVAAEADTRDSLQLALARFVALAPRLVDGRSHAEAAATLVSRISEAATRAALRVSRVESLSDSARGSIQPVSVQAELEGDVAGLVKFLQDIEGGAQILTIRSLNVTAPNPLDLGPVETLRVQFTLSGWHLTEGGR